MSALNLIPGHPEITELGFANPFIFITVSASTPETPAHPSEQATISKTNGSAESILYVTFNIPDISFFPGATANSKAYLVPLPTSVGGDNTVEVFSLLPGVNTLPTSITYDGRPSPNLQLSSVTFGGAGGVTPVVYTSFDAVTPNLGGPQSFMVRCTGDNADISFSVSPVDTSPNGMALVIGNTE
jgi:hypothetical protein